MGSKFGLENLNEINNGFTWMKCFTLGCRKVAEAVVFKISNGKTVQKWHALFRVEEKSPLLRKDNMKLPYFLVANWYIGKVIHKYSPHDAMSGDSRRVDNQACIDYASNNYYVGVHKKKDMIW